jgi:hypothetical protein
MKEKKIDKKKRRIRTGKRRLGSVRHSKYKKNRINLETI